MESAIVDCRRGGTVPSVVSTLIPVIIRRASHNRHSCSVCSHLLGRHIVFLANRIRSRVTGLIITRLLFLRSRGPSGSVFLCVGSPNNSIATNVSVCSAVRFVGPGIDAMYVNRTYSVNTFLLTNNTPNGHCMLPGSHMVVRRPLNNFRNRTSSVRVRTRRVLAVGGGLGALLTRRANRPLRIVRGSASRF